MGFKKYELCGKWAITVIYPLIPVGQLEHGHNTRLYSAKQGIIRDVKKR